MENPDPTPMWSETRSEAGTMDIGLRSFMLSVYNYMASALALTGITAYLAAHWHPLMDALYWQPDANHMQLTGLGWIVLFAPLVFVMVMSFGMNRLSLGAAQMLYWAYSAVMGLSLSSLFFVYSGQSLTRVFLITAIVFGSMSLWGYTSKRDLTGMGHFMFMGLWGLIITSIISMFIGGSGLQFVISLLGVIIFTGLTAYDTQKIKAIYYQTRGSSDSAGKGAIFGALALYLDFINLFIMLLRLFGDRRN